MEKMMVGDFCAYFIMLYVKTNIFKNIQDILNILRLIIIFAVNFELFCRRRSGLANRI